MISFSKATFGSSEHTVRFAAVVREQSSTFERRMNDCLLLLYSLPFLVCFHCLSLPETVYWFQQMGGSGTAVALRRKGNDNTRWLIQVDGAGQPVTVAVSATGAETAGGGGGGGSGESVGMCVAIGASGWLQNDEDGFTHHWQF